VSRRINRVNHTALLYLPVALTSVPASTRRWCRSANGEPGWVVIDDGRLIGWPPTIGWRRAGPETVNPANQKVRQQIPAVALCSRCLHRSPHGETSGTSQLAPTPRSTWTPTVGTPQLISVNLDLRAKCDLLLERHWINGQSTQFRNKARRW